VTGAPRTIFVSAGDTSGDHHGARLVAELRSRFPAARFVGFGGSALRSAGVELIEPLADAPVMGFAPVLARIGHFVRLLNGADRWLRANRPAALVAIDYPGFNVRLAALAKRAGIPVAYWICPQYWGWAPWRARRFARAVDLALALMPFEVDFLAQHGIAARFVGHPLADALAGVTPAPRDAAALALLPGSRRAEIEALLPWQLRAARVLRQRVGTGFRLLTAHPRAERRARIAELAAIAEVPLEVRDQPLPELLRECRAAVVTSGTATLECALMRVPAAIVYRVNGFSMWASRFILTSPCIGLPNLLAGETLFPEFLAVDDPGAALDAALERLFLSGAARDRCLERLDALRASVLVPGAARNAAAAIAELIAGW
jgi:lipid-A-disaccharide synthase